MNTNIFAILTENETLKTNILRSADLLNIAAKSISDLQVEVSNLQERNSELEALAETMESEIEELTDTLESLEDADGCTCDEDENEHYNDTNANEDFLKEMALILANDESISPSEIPQLLTDIVTAIKLNTSR